MRAVLSFSSFICISFFLLCSLPSCRTASVFGSTSSLANAYERLVPESSSIAEAVEKPASSWFSKLTGRRKVEALTEGVSFKPPLSMRLDGTVQPVGFHEPYLNIHTQYRDGVEIYLVRSEEQSRSGIASAGWESKLSRPIKVEKFNGGYRLINDGTHARLFRFGDQQIAYLVYPKQKQFIPANVLSQNQVNAVQVKKVPNGYRFVTDDDEAVIPK